MKKLFSILVFALGIISYSQNTFVPDDNFEQALIDLGYDAGPLDDYVPTANINNVTFLDVSSLNITDLSGIKDFIALEELKCNDNQLTSINLHQNINLTILNCSFNQLTNINLTQNTALTTLWCFNNQITNLDITQNTALTTIWCYNNQLTNLNVRNGNNTIINNIFFIATNNPNLSCIEVDDAVWSTNNWQNIDAQSYFANDCSLTYVPDDNFEAYLEAHSMGNGIANDDYVLTENINAVTALDVSDQGITDLTGVEDFISLTELYCYSNNLTSLDVTQNTALTILNCNSNNLTSLGLIQNTGLTELLCSNNNLTNLDLTQNLALTILWCHTNNLTSLDLTQNTALTILWCPYNNLTNLDLTQNTALIHLVCYDNDLTSLDVTQNTTLSRLWCYNNQLTGLNVRNGNNMLMVINSFKAKNNPNLNCIEVDDVVWSTNNWQQNIDATASFSEDCGTYVPDDNFEQALIDLGYDNGPLDDYVPTANINNVTVLNVSNQNITDLTGIEDFIALTELQCPSNNLTSLNITQNTALTHLDCVGNNLASLDLTQNMALTFLRCYTNNLTSLDLTQNTVLTDLQCFNNQITNLDITQNTALTTLLCHANDLTSLDVTQNMALISLWCNNNQLTSLDLTQNTVLTNLQCYNNQITNLDVTQNTVLTNLQCYNNQITNLDVTQNRDLIVFSCKNNQLTSLDLTQNRDLIVFSCKNNQLTSLDLTQNRDLISFYCENNQLTSLDISINMALVNLHCFNNQLNSLNVKNTNNTNFNFFDVRNNPNLSCIEVDDATWSTANWQNIDAQSYFANNCSLTYVPDDNFEQAIIDLGYDNGPLDDYVPTANINNVTFLFIDSEQIFDLTGIEDFIALEYLDCSNNFLTSLDLSGNTALIELNCERNALTSIDVTQCLALDRLSVWRNQLTTINSSQNINLTRLICFNNNINALDLSQNTVLENLFCDENQLNTLDVTQNTALISLTCEDNQLSVLNVTQNILLDDLRFRNNLLTTIDLSNNTLLDNLSCDNNQLTGLDLTQNVNLRKLYCYDNQLTSLNIKNGNNLNIINFNALNNPNLTCIEVDNAAYSTANWSDIDATASFSENCGFCTDTTTYTSSGWNPAAPTSNSSVIIAYDYFSSLDGGSINACEITINTGVTLTIAAGDYLNVENNITVDGTLDVQHEGSVVQTNNLATVANNGSITVRKTTPTLVPSSFMILGNPMTEETREGVYTSAARVLHHITGNFVPNPAVGSDTENFADDNNNNWDFHTGILTPAEGYLVKPLFSGSPEGTFDFNYTLGTLNNGVVNFNLLYNGTREASANMLGNPYASAIDNDLFLAANPLLDAIYYWQHITPPVDTFPGFNQLNFNIGDLSVYNQGSGGVEASNGGGIPTQFMASGQGFGVKALGAGTVTFNNSMRVTGPNTDYRSPENNDRQRIWLDLNNETYGLKSNMLIAFTQNATDGFENKFDSKRFDTPISLYSILEDETELAIQGRTAFDIDQEVLLGFKTYVEEEENYTISIRQLEGVDIENTEVYLEDRMLNTVTNLSEENYSFTSNAIQQNDRFVLLFQEKVLDISENSIESIVVYPVPSTSNITIVNPQGLELTRATIYDLFGRVIQVIDLLEINTQKIIDITNLATANYLLIIEGEQGAILKQIVKE